MVNRKHKFSVLIVSQYFVPDIGGAATRAYNMAKGLTKNGCKVQVVAAFPHYPYGKIPDVYRRKLFKIEELEGIQVIRTAVPPIRSEGLFKRAIIFLCFMLSSLLALPYVDKVNAVWAANPNILGMMPSYIFSRKFKATLAMNVDDLWPDGIYSIGMMKKDTLVGAFSESLVRKTYERADIITPISPGYIDVISKKYSITPDKIKVVRAGVDIEKFRQANSHKNKTYYDILYSGAFSPAYDFNQVLRAAELTQKGGHKIRFILQGGGELAGAIMNAISNMRIKNVVLINRVMPREKVASLLREADALLLPLRDFGSPYLGISSKVYEYQATGKPILCCCEGQPADYLSSTRSGLVVKPGDYEALARCAISLCTNAELTRQLGRNGRLNAESNLSLESIGSRMLDVLSNLDEN